jgi:hypothetical protein
MKMLLGISCLVGSLALCACDAVDDAEIIDDVELRNIIVGGGGSGDGKWLSNGLHNPNVGAFDPAHALTSEAGLSSDALADSALLATARYAIECALPTGSSVTKVVNGQNVVFSGILGLAPEWESEACDEDCQEWVSACLLARTNVSGQTVHIGIAGDHEALGVQPPSGAVLEAGFYGNLFAAGGGRYLCKGSALSVVAAFREGRTCSMGGGASCGFTAYADCSSFSRCTLDGPNQDVPSNCKAGSTATSQPYHTVATYVIP